MQQQLIDIRWNVITLQYSLWKDPVIYSYRQKFNKEGIFFFTLYWAFPINLPSSYPDCQIAIINLCHQCMRSITILLIFTQAPCNHLMFMADPGQCAVKIHQFHYLHLHHYHQCLTLIITVIPWDILIGRINWHFLKILLEMNSLLITLIWREVQLALHKNRWYIFIFTWSWIRIEQSFFLLKYLYLHLSKECVDYPPLITHKLEKVSEPLR